LLIAPLAIALSVLSPGATAVGADPLAGQAQGRQAAPGQAVRASRVALERTARVPDLPAKANGRHVRTARASVAEDVAVVGVTLSAPDPAAEVYVRDTGSGGTAEWTKLDLDADASGSAGTDPFVVTDASSVEVALVSATTATAELQVYASAPTAADALAADATAPLARTASVTAGASTDPQYAWADPQILSRKAWSANESIVDLPYDYAQVTGVMIHHTAGSNSYTSGEVPSILRSIQAYHVNGRGWKDIAYNVLVDRFGRAWEGRGGGIDRAVQGGHAWGVTNARVFGLSVMGNYENATPTSTTLDTVSKVIAWKFRVHGGIDPYGSTWGSGGQDGGSTYLPAISGHRNENATACPGANIYSKMGTIRSKVATYLDTLYPGGPQFTSVSAPKISGTAQVEKTLTATTSAWVPAPALAHQWYRVESDGTSSAITGATGTSYTLTAADRGRKIKVRVVGTLAGYPTVTKYSALTATVAYGVFATTPTPTVTGTAQVEKTLTATPGTWSPDATLKYQWYRVASDGTSTSITGATSSSYTLTSSDRGKKVKVRVSGYRSGYTTVRKYSALTSTVAYGVFTATPTPTVTGTAQVGQKLTAAPGSWSPAATFKYQWYRVASDGTSTSITGATSSSYTLTSSDRGKKVKVRVSGYRSGYTTVRKYSALTPSVAYGVFTTQTTPTITGTVKSGYTLTARHGTWTPAASFTYRWYRVTSTGTSSAISGATASTYRLTSGDRGRQIKVRVTAKRSGFTSVTMDSALTVRVP